MAKQVTITQFGLQGDTDRTVYITWTWTKKQTENYKVKWYYFVDGVWFIGEDGTTEQKQSIYNAPANATKVKVTVKPIAKKKKKGGKEVEEWKAEWSTKKEYAFAANPPSTPAVPNVEIEKDEYMLRATLDNLDLNAHVIEFQVIKDDSSIFKHSKSSIIFATKNGTTAGYVTYTCFIDAGHKYKVRARAYNTDTDLYSDWTEYSGNVSTKPNASKGITTCRANSETSILVEWSAVASAETYELEYTNKLTNFDYTGDTTITPATKFTKYEVTGLERGEEYFFRVRALNENGESAWSEPVSVILGEPPTLPTTWSTTTTAMVGEPVVLHWLHNSKDGSTQRLAQIEITINGSRSVITRDTSNQPDDEKIMYYAVDTSKYTEGTKIEWRVRTAGVTGVYGEWSILRKIDVYAPPVLEIQMTKADGTIITDRGLLETFPFYISAQAGPDTQSPIGYHVSIVSNVTYETIDDVGRIKLVNANEDVYSRYFDTTDDLLVEISAGDIDLENNMHYTINCSVTMDSGLTGEDSTSFIVAWEDVAYEPNVRLGVDPERLTASIIPYCEDEEGNEITGVTMAVYRREFDGSFTEIAKNIRDNNTFIVDPHPALDYARYRVVAIDDATGSVSYYDIPGEPIGETSIVIQWDEQWSTFDVDEESATEEPIHSGSMLKLPYNIDISDNHRNDVTMVNYIGREHPVSYYGTQLGVTSTWNAVIEKTDAERLYALRRLSRWMGNVYVREPSGSGYWANVTVSFEIKHLEMTIPVTLNVTRVSGGA